MKKILIIPFVILFFSCSREIDFYPVDVEQELVVSAFIQPGQFDSLLLTSTFISSQSADYYEDGYKYFGVSGAKVAVLANNDTVGNYVEAENMSYHYEGESFDENKEYQLKVSHPNYPDVSAKTTVPVVPDFWFGTYANGDEKVIEINEPDIQVLLEFEDDNNVNNYYMVTASSTYEYILRVGFPNERDSIIEYTEPAQLNSKSSIVEITYNGSFYDFAQLSYDWETFYDVSETGIIFSDKLFNGQKVTIPVDLRLYEYKRATYIHLSVISISKEYYQMLRSIVTLEKNNNSFFPEPLQIYSNVQNGHGMWAAKSSKIVTLDVSEIELYKNE